MKKTSKTTKEFFETRTRDALSIADEQTSLGYIFRRKQNVVIEMLKPGKMHKVLEVGSGSGLGAVFVAKYVDNVLATDISKSRLKIANAQAKSRKLQRKIDFVVCDALELPFRDSCFDSAFCIGLLHHMPRYTKCLMEIVRTARKFLCIEPNSFNPLRREDARTATPERAAHEHDIPFFLLKRCFRNCGLVNLKVRWILFVWPRLEGPFLNLAYKLSFALEKIPLLNILAGNIVVLGER